MLCYHIFKNRRYGDWYVTTTLRAQGVVASTAQLLYGFGCNIIESDQFTDTSVDQFFQRITFDYSSLHVGLGNRPILERAIQELASRCVVAKVIDQFRTVSSCTPINVRP